MMPVFIKYNVKSAFKGDYKFIIYFGGTMWMMGFTYSY